MGNFIDLTGQRFGLLTAKSFSSHTQKWECLCDCGNVYFTRSQALRLGSVKGCGCVQRNTTHGMTDTPEYQAWVSMRKRCHNPSHKQYADYGGRGITVCEEWRDDFGAFFRDMGPRPMGRVGKRVYSVDRKDNSLGYFKDNCHWATQAQQQRNRRSNRLVTHNGITQNITEWAENVGIRRDTLTARIDAGWPLSQALTSSRKYR